MRGVLSARVSSEISFGYQFAVHNGCSNLWSLRRLRCACRNDAIQLHKTSFPGKMNKSCTPSMHKSKTRSHYGAHF